MIYAAVHNDASKNPLTSLGGGSGGSGGQDGTGGGSGGFGTTCPPGQQRTEKRFCIPCDSATAYVVGEQCISKDTGKPTSVSSNQTPADSGFGQLVEVKAYKNGVEVTDVLSK